MIHDMKKWAQAYLDGLTTSKEFLGQIINAVGKEYEATSPGHNDNVEAGDLAKLLVGE